MNIFAKVEKRIKDALIEYFTRFIVETINDVVDNKLFQDPQTVSLTILNSSSLNVDNTPVQYGIYKIDATKSRAAEIYVGPASAEVRVNAKKNTSGVLYVHYAADVPGKLHFDPAGNLFNEGFDLSYEPGKTDMLFWTRKGNDMYWRRAKSF